jgi:hypothetical protein
VHVKEVQVPGYYVVMFSKINNKKATPFLGLRQNARKLDV